MTKIFVSYSHTQGEWVASCLVPVLRAGGAEVLIDWERFKGGTAVVGQMDKVQDQADVQLVCLSAEYLASDYCRREMRRAISRDPNFARGLDDRIKRGLVVPIRLDGTTWPAEITDPNPIFVDLRDSTVASDSWQLLMKPCRVNLGITAQAWLSARDDIVRYLQRGQSVNLLVKHEGIAWEFLVQDIVRERAAPMAWIDLQEPSTSTRHGLLNRILERLGARETVRQAPNDLADFERIFTTMPKPSKVSICNFDLAPHRKRYGLDLYASLRWMIANTRQLVLLVQSRTPFNALLPRDNPLSKIDIKTVRLG
jgi:TIR domain